MFLTNDVRTCLQLFRRSPLERITVADGFTEKKERKSRGRNLEKRPQEQPVLGGGCLPLGGSVTSILPFLSLYFIYIYIYTRCITIYICFHLSHSFFPLTYGLFHAHPLTIHRSVGKLTTHTGKFYRCPGSPRVLRREADARTQSTVRSTKMRRRRARRRGS